MRGRRRGGGGAGGGEGRGGVREEEKEEEEEGRKRGRSKGGRGEAELYCHFKKCTQKTYCKLFFFSKLLPERQSNSTTVQGIKTSIDKLPRCRP